MATFKNIILLALTSLVMVGCGKDVQYSIEGMEISIIDSCEYIKCYTYGFNSFVYCHKGNCKFCKERRQKELKELVNKLKEK